MWQWISVYDLQFGVITNVVFLFCLFFFFFAQCDRCFMNYVVWIFTKLMFSSREVPEADICTSCAWFWTWKKLCSLCGIVSQRRRNFHYNYYFPRPKHDGRTDGCPAFYKYNNNIILDNNNNNNNNCGFCDGNTSFIYRILYSPLP